MNTVTYLHTSIAVCMVYLDDGIVLAVLLEPLLDELDHDADEPDNGDDQGAQS